MQIENCEIQVPNELAMQTLGKSIAAELLPPTLITLSGDLGVGKTLLARAVIQALGYAGAVKSPTYTLVETYCLEGWRIAHLDLYRLHDPDELHYIGFRDLLDTQDLLLIEWPEKAADELPQADLAIHIAYAGSARRVCIDGLGNS